MIFVYPIRPRPMLRRYIMWLPVFLTVLWFHTSLGIQYAWFWANESLIPETVKE